MQGTSHQHMSDYLSTLIEDTLTTLEQAKCIGIEDESAFPCLIATETWLNRSLIIVDLEALNLGLVASFYQVSSVSLNAVG